MLIYLLLGICLLILALFYFTKEYDSFNGMILVFLAISVILTRAFFLEGIPNLFYVSSTIATSFFYTGIVTLLSIIGLFLIRRYNNKRPLLLFFLYLIAGFLQQLLFQYVFLELVYYLIKNLILTIVIGTSYYALFHLKQGRRFFIFTFVIGLAWSTIYLTTGNILPLAISHGVLGTAYYTWLYKGDPVKGRSRLFSKFLKN